MEPYIIYSSIYLSLAHPSFNLLPAKIRQNVYHHYDEVGVLKIFLSYLTIYIFLFECMFKLFTSCVPVFLLDAFDFDTIRLEDYQTGTENSKSEKMDGQNWNKEIWKVYDQN